MVGVAVGVGVVVVVEVSVGVAVGVAMMPKPPTPTEPPEPKRHCWEDSADHHSTCMEMDGHEGPHVFVPDSQITVRLPDPPLRGSDV